MLNVMDEYLLSHLSNFIEGRQNFQFSQSSPEDSPGAKFGGGEVQMTNKWIYTYSRKMAASFLFFTQRLMVYQ